MKNLLLMATLLLLVCNSWASTQAVSLAAEPSLRLNLSRAIALAQLRDPWLRGSQLQQQAFSDLSIAAAALPDIEVSLSVSNLPLDTLSLGQEPMTQLKVGVSQKFPRGNTLALRQQQLLQRAERQPFMRANRLAKVEARVAQLWLDAYFAKTSIRYIEADRELFEYLVDVSKSNYRSGLLKTHQQDFIRAQLELTRLDDRLLNLNSHLDVAKAKLSQWLLDEHGQVISNWLMDEALPAVPLKHSSLMAEFDNNRLAQQFNRHPLMADIAQKYKTRQTSVQLAKQKYQPEVGLSAFYGRRSDGPSGIERADLVTLGIGFDLPIFTDNKQDRQLSAAKSEAEMVRTEKALTIQSLVSGFNAQRVKLQRLQQRQKIYHQRLLAQVSEQAQASLNAYTNDNGDFAEAVRARIAELNTRIDSLSLAVKSRQAQAQINYYLATVRSGE